MQGKSIAILGAGISGLSLALKASTIPQLRYKIFEKAQRPGGRVFSPNVSNNLSADIGANLIDFQDEKQELSVRKFLKEHNLDHLSPFRQPFLVYDGSLKQGDHHKERYFYSGGFERLIQGITNKLPKQAFVFNHPVSRIQRKQQHWELFDSNDQMYPETFSHLVVALTGSAALQLFKTSNLQQTKGIQQLLQESPYTRQISAGFRAKKHPPFSSILFKNHPVTFMSSHDEKYPQSAEKIIVIQMNEEFSKVHHEQTKEQIGMSIIKQLPKEMQDWIGQCVKLKRWKSSLLKNKVQRDLNAFQIDSLNLMMVGDVCKGSSRVAGAIETSLGKL